MVKRMIMPTRLAMAMVMIMIMIMLVSLTKLRMNRTKIKLVMMITGLVLMRLLAFICAHGVVTMVMIMPTIMMSCMFV
jgi:hypothetical protein